MENIYVLADKTICSKIGEKIRANRLRQNITQQKLAEDSNVALSTLKRIECGQIGSFDSLLRIVRMLHMLDLLQPLTEEEGLTPNEYYDLVFKAQKKKRKRASRI